MSPKTEQKLQAIKLRKKGFSYSEIIKSVRVSQSSLSLWLHDMELTKSQRLRLSKKGDLARKLGSGALHEQRILKTKLIVKKAVSEIKNLDKNDLMLIGITLYWAEGNKQKEHNPSTEVIFSNSDPKMIQVYLMWLKVCLKIPDDRLVFEIYIHKTYRKTEGDLKRHWSLVTNIPVSKFNKIYYKKNKTHSYRRNRGPEYNGVLRIKIRKSTDLNRKIAGWIQGVCLQGWSSLPK